MTLTLTDVAPYPRAGTDVAVWPVRVTSSGGEEHRLRLPHAEGDAAPTWSDVQSHLAALPEGHDLAGARLARWLTQRQYLALITDEELLDITDASEGRGGFEREQRKVARRAVEMTRSGDDIDLAARETRFLVLQLGRKGLLSEGRAGEILAGERPA